MGVFWFYCPPMFNFLLFMIKITSEKEKKLRMGMSIVGLTDSAYWISWIITHIIISLITVSIFVISGYAFLFDFFLKTNPLIIFIYFFTFSVSLIPFGYLLTAFVSKISSATVLGFLVFVIGLILQMFFGDFPVYIWYQDSISKVWQYLFMFYPPYNFAKVFADISYVTTSEFGNSTSSYYGFNEFVSSQRIDYLNADSPPAIVSILFMIMNGAIFMVLAIYFDNIIAGDVGIESKPFYYFLTPHYWGFYKNTGAYQDIEKIYLLQKELNNDVQQEMVRTLESDQDVPVKVLGLTKEYSKGVLGCCKKSFAVSKLYFSIDKGECFCLLGHNGAGKTTTFNMLTGLFTPTNGDAQIYGLSIVNEMDKVRQILGVCHQHDILWNELTPEEHLEIFARFKGIISTNIPEMIENILKDVELYDVRNHRSDTFSGGMQRRLSLAISCIGNPNIIFLDEPTTGLDPIARNNVWKLIEKMKKNRVIVLTTHSMQEADHLADRIGIMTYGKLFCIGNSIHLKNYHGDGYHLNLVVDSVKVEDTKEFVKQHLGADLISDNSGNLKYVISNNDKISSFFERVENKEIDIIEWSLSQTSLEDVFLKITKEAHQKNN